MIALRITNVKQFMSKLLTGDTFDSFLLEEASISTFNTFHIDGRQNNAFYSKEEWENPDIRPYDFSLWKSIRPICYELIKGTHTPSAFHFVLHLIPDYIPSILKKEETVVVPNQVKAFVLNIKYDNTGLSLITATSLTTFLADKTPDRLWDKAIKVFLAKKEIEYEEL